MRIVFSSAQLRAVLQFSVLGNDHRGTSMGSGWGTVIVLTRRSYADWAGDQGQAVVVSRM